LGEFSTYLAATPLDAKPRKNVQFPLHFVPEWKKQTLPQMTLITLIHTDKAANQNFHHGDAEARRHEGEESVSTPDESGKSPQGDGWQ